MDLQPLTTGERLNDSRMTLNRARRVAKVPPEAFEKFLERKDPDQLTRAKLPSPTLWIWCLVLTRRIA